jgi:hypothetical protein
MNKLYWHRQTTAFLVRVAKALGIAQVERSIRSNKGGPAVGGEVTMSAPKFGVYVSLACPVNAYGEKDWIGASYARKATIADPYGAGMDKPNHSLAHGHNETWLVERLKEIAR